MAIPNISAGIGLAILLVLAGTPSVAAEAKPAYTDLAPVTLNGMIEKKDFFLVNVHVPYEGEIRQTDAFIPFNQIEQQAGKLPAAKDAKIVLYCMSDRMSTIAAEKLVGLGYRNVWNLKGGMVAWRERGYPLLDKR